MDLNDPSGFSEAAKLASLAQINEIRAELLLKLYEKL